MSVAAPKIAPLSVRMTVTVGPFPSQPSWNSFPVPPAGDSNLEKHRVNWGVVSVKKAKSFLIHLTIVATCSFVKTPEGYLVVVVFVVVVVAEVVVVVVVVVDDAVVVVVVAVAVAVVVVEGLRLTMPWLSWWWRLSLQHADQTQSEVQRSAFQA